MVHGPAQVNIPTFTIALLCSILLYTRIIIKNYIYKTSIASISSKTTGSVAQLVQGLDKLIFRVRCKVHQQMIKWSGNLGRISEHEKVSFQIVTERNYAV